MLLPPLFRAVAIAAVAIVLSPSLSFAQIGEPTVAPLPGEPHIQPLDEADLAAMEAADAEADAEADAKADAEAAAAAATPEPAAPEPEPIAEPAPTGATATPDAEPEMTRAEYAAALREVVRSMRGTVEQKILASVQAKQAERMDYLAGFLAIVAFGGLLMLLAPLVLRRRYPGRDRVLWKYSAVSAGLFFLAVNLFAGVLMVLRGAQDAAGEYTNPQVQVVQATFDLIDNKAEELADVGPVLIEPTLMGLAEESGKPVLSIMLDNMSQLREDVGVFASVGNFFSRLDWAFGLLPLVLVGLALLLFVQAAKPTLMEIIGLPARAAGQGGHGLAKAALTSTLRNVWQELKSTAGLLGMLIGISIIAGVCLGWVLQPAIEIFMAYLTLAYVYVQAVESVSSFWIVFSLGSTILFLAVNLLIMVVATALVLGKGQRIFQQRFRNAVPLRAHRRFWMWGSASLALIFLLPVVYMRIADPVMSWLVVKTFSETSWGWNLGFGPALFLLTFGVVFWAARGFAAFKFIATYKPAVEAEGIGELDTLPRVASPTERVTPLAYGSWQTAQSALRPDLEKTPDHDNRRPRPTQYPAAAPALLEGGYPSLPVKKPAPKPGWRTSPPPPPPSHTRHTVLDRPPTPRPTPPTAIATPPPPPIPDQEVAPRRAATVPPPIPAAARKARVARGSSPPLTDKNHRD